MAHAFFGTWSPRSRLLIVLIEIQTIFFQKKGGIILLASLFSFARDLNADIEDEIMSYDDETQVIVDNV